MHLLIVLFGAIFCISLILTMVGLGGGLIFSPFFLILGFSKSDAASASLFLNLVAAASAAYAYSREKMVDYSLSIPLIISSALAAPVGSYFNVRIDLQPLLVIMAVVLALAGGRMFFSPAASAEPDAADAGPQNYQRDRHRGRHRRDGRIAGHRGYAIATAMEPSQILASSLLMGVFLLIVGLTGAIELIRKITPKAAIRGVQLSTGALLISGGIKFIIGTSKFQALQQAAEPYLSI